MQVLLLVLSHFLSLSIFTKACVIIVLIRHHLEFLYVDVISPIEHSRGHNRVKIYVGTFGIAYPYYIRLEIMNSNFSDYTRIPIMLGSCILTLYSLARLQFHGKYEILGKDFENLPMILGLGLMQTTNMVVVFDGQKKIQKQLLKETIQRIQKDSEL